MPKILSKAQEYVRSYRNTQMLWADLSAEEKAQANLGLSFLAAINDPHIGMKPRGRPVGSKNRSTPADAAKPPVNGPAEQAADGLLK